MFSVFLFTSLFLHIRIAQSCIIAHHADHSLFFLALLQPAVHYASSVLFFRFRSGLCISATVYHVLFRQYHESARTPVKGRNGNGKRATKKRNGRKGNRKNGQLEKSATKNDRVGKQGNTKLFSEIATTEKTATEKRQRENGQMKIGQRENDQCGLRKFRQSKSSVYR